MQEESHRDRGYPGGVGLPGWAFVAGWGDDIAAPRTASTASSMVSASGYVGGYVTGDSDDLLPHFLSSDNVSLSELRG